MDVVSKLPQDRPADAWPRLREVSPQERGRPTGKTLVELVWNTVALLFHDSAAIILGSAFFLVMVWGQHGNLELLGLVLAGWRGPGSDPATRDRYLGAIPWDQEWISFVAGAVLLVAVPVVLIKVVLRQDLKDYGLGLPPPGRRALGWLSAAALLLVSLPAFYLGIHDPGMRAVYPLYRGFTTVAQFLLYQLGYVLFFVAMEFMFRGYLLFGLYQLKDRDVRSRVTGIPGPQLFGYLAVFISMLSYTAWHLGKPLPELWGTLFWGLAAGAIALESRSIVPITLVHWLLNVFLDYGIWRGWCGWPFCRG